MKNFLWLWRMAWRDSRRSRGRLLLFLSAIVLGIAALVGINGFRANLTRSLDDQARELVGADLVLSSPQPFKPLFSLAPTSPAESAYPRPNLKPILERLVREVSQEAAFASLVQFPKGQGVRLAQVRALGGRFPYYGAWVTEPTSAVAVFRRAEETGRRVALVDDALLAQFAAKPGDSIRVGKLTFLVAGRVRKTPGQSGFSAAVAPAVFIPFALLPETGLIQPGSRVQYRNYYRFASTTNPALLENPLEDARDQARIDSDTVAERKRQTGRAFTDLTRFLSLVSFVALLLGCVGVASAVSLYVREKVGSVAVLRCLGASGWQAMSIYLLQIAVMGLLGATIGAALGTAVQLFLPRVFADFLPVAVEVTVAWGAVAQGVFTGLLVSVLFALLPLLSIRRVSPLRTLRATDDAADARPDPLRGLVYGLLVAFILGFAYLQTRDWKQALGFTAGLLVAFAALAGVGAGLRALVRRFFPTSWSYAWRQGLANLYRPNNQTLLLTVSVGLGVFLLATLFVLQGLLLSRVQISGSGNQPNLVLFDIQPEQQAGVRALLTSRRLPILEQVPIVTMRLSALNGRSATALAKDTARGAVRRSLTREFRVTYRDTLTSAEKLLAGRPPYLGPDGIARVSMEQRYFDQLKLRLGDTLVFNVQGAPITTIIGGTREVDWARVRTNFLLIFPTGVLEPAPQSHVILSRVPDNAALAAVQRALVSGFPNVSAIDLGLVLQTLDDILSKISFVIRFMALFSIATGLLVLISAVVVSRYQRVRESVLLRTLGASRNQILRITLVEYAVLGLLAAATGLVLALGAGWALAYWVFEAPFRVNAGPLLLLAGLTSLLTVLIGLFNSRDVLTRPPLEVLREEG